MLSQRTIPAPAKPITITAKILARNGAVRNVGRCGADRHLDPKPIYNESGCDERPDVLRHRSIDVAVSTVNG